MLLRLLAALALVAVLAMGAVSYREQARVAGMDASMSAQRELAVTRLAPAGTAPRAGVSARAPIRVQPIPGRLTSQLRDDPDFHRLSHRCGVCHTTPDPALHGAAEWPQIVARMAGTVEAAGLLPLSAADRDAVLRVLREHSRPDR